MERTSIAMNLDIHDAVITTVIVLVLGSILCAITGIRTLLSSNRTAYHRIQKKQEKSGWGTLFIALFMLLFSGYIALYGEPTAYKYFPPSPTLSPTHTITIPPTISETPTIFLTPTMSLTPAESYTPTNSPTPHIPELIETQFSGIVTPDPNAVFSPLVFSREVSNYLPVQPQTVFSLPISTLFATYTYDMMLNGVQWTALLYRDEDLIGYETSPWEGGTGGYGQYLLEPSDKKWPIGNYKLLFFVGIQYKVMGEFRIIENP